MRKFSSYGPIDKSLNYYAPRKELIEKGLRELLGEDPEKNGHYITVWGARQTGKTFTLQQILWKLQKDDRFDVVKINLELLKTEEDIKEILTYIEDSIAYELNKKSTGADTPKKFENLFLKEALDKPLILIIDEFDALSEEAISTIVGAFRNIYNKRKEESERPEKEKKYLLHSVALIGVRSVLGIENKKGSPFNVQRSLHIPNLTFEEVEEMFKWYEKESGQKVEQEVIERLYYETSGQPGLTCWFGELLTEGLDRFVPEKNKPIDMDTFEKAYMHATYILPNSNILNIISKVKNDPYKGIVLNMFRTDKKIVFKYDDNALNYLYMNGVIDWEAEADDKNPYVKFAAAFIQKRLFNYFSNDIFGSLYELTEPFEDISNAITEDSLNIKNIMRLYNKYLLKNNEWFLKEAPRRSDMRIYEAAFHFNLYVYLCDFLTDRGAKVFPEFPTGNGKIDLIIKYSGKVYGVELKTFKDIAAYKKALEQAAHYAARLELKEISLVFFVEYIDDENRSKYEVDYLDKTTGITVIPIFVETWNQAL